jgi:putative acetyltransferase
MKGKSGLPMRQKPLIRPETIADQGAIRELADAAFGTPGEAKLVDAIRNTSSYVPELSLVAEIDGQVIEQLV